MCVGTIAKVTDETSDFAYTITLRWATEEGWENAKKDEEGFKAVKEDVPVFTNGEVVLVVGKVF